MTEREWVIKELECIRDYDPMIRTTHDDVFKGYAEDAIALLKAQEPRVMTLEEALGAEECWLERKDCCVTVASIALNGQDSGGYDVDSNELNTMRSYIFHSGYYGKYWRCWNIRPTDEQREATPWN